MIALDIVTPVTRPVLLRKLEQGIRPATRFFDLHWHLIHDCLCPSSPCDLFSRSVPRFKDHYLSTHIPVEGSEAGWGQRIHHLDNGSREGFLWWCDDDTLIPDGFFDRLNMHISDSVDMVVYAMAYPYRQECGTRILHPNPKSIKVGDISGSMAIMRRSIIGTLRPALTRTSDGTFLEALIPTIDPDRILWVDEPWILYNAQNPERCQ